jgi:hypothetical protein
MITNKSLKSFESRIYGLPFTMLNMWFFFKIYCYESNLPTHFSMSSLDSQICFAPFVSSKNVSMTINAMANKKRRKDMQWSTNHYNLKTEGKTTWTPPKNGCKRMCSGRVSNIFLSVGIRFGHQTWFSAFCTLMKDKIVEAILYTT